MKRLLVILLMLILGCGLFYNMGLLIIMAVPNTANVIGSFIFLFLMLVAYYIYDQHI